MNNLTQKLHDIYLPFGEDVLKEHFIANEEGTNLDKHISYYKESIERYKEFEDRRGIERGEIKKIRQIEKDEKFWTASTFLTLFDSPTQNGDLIKMLERAYGQTPPLKNFENWAECLEGKLHVYFEPGLSSPKSYRDWLKDNFEHLIPYVIKHARDKEGKFKTNLEGTTYVDALILNADNGFAVVIEAKVLSDISYDITYDMTRNQIIRNVDVMLDANHNLREPLNKRKPENSLFLLVTPEIFKANPHTRFYGYKYLDYKNNPSTIAKALPHRELDSEQSKDLSNRIGWTTWERLREINNNCCKWLST